MFYPNVNHQGPEGICARSQLFSEELKITPFPDANRCSICGLYGLLVKIYPRKTLLIPIHSAFRGFRSNEKEWGWLPKEDQMSLLFQGPTCFFFCNDCFLTRFVLALDYVVLQQAWSRMSPIYVSSTNQIIAMEHPPLTSMIFLWKHMKTSIHRGFLQFSSSRNTSNTSGSQFPSFEPGLGLGCRAIGGRAVPWGISGKVTDGDPEMEILALNMGH